MKKTFLILLFSLFLIPLTASALTDTQCTAGGGTYSSGICTCPTHSSWSGDTCECDYQYTGSKGNCTKITSGGTDTRYLPPSQEQQNCKAILCAATCDPRGTGICSTVKQQAYWNGSKCECPANYYSSLAPTAGSSGGSSQQSSGGSSQQSSGGSSQQSSVGGSSNIPTGPGQGGIQIDNPIKAKTFEELIDNLVNFLFYVAIVLAPLMIVWGGILFLSSGGDSKKYETGKSVIMYAAIGLFIVMFAKGVISIVRNIIK